ncbi:MAG: CBS domain-containing protein [Candidatus Odinarchaeia archaeon]
MKVVEVMSSPVVACDKQDTIARVRNLMLKHQVGRIIIIDKNEKPVGILTQKDLVYSIKKSSPLWRRRPLDTILVKNIMSKKLVTITSNADILDAVSTLKKTAFSALPVVENNKLVGIITKTDIVRALPGFADSAIQVKRFMTKPAITAKPSHSVMYVYDLMVENNISRVIITHLEKPLGIITLKDIVFLSGGFLETGLNQSHTSFYASERIQKHHKPPVAKIRILAEEVMSQNLITVRENESIIKASELLIKNNIGGLPVLDEKGVKLVGIITKRDIINKIIGGR